MWGFRATNTASASFTVFYRLRLAEREGFEPPCRLRGKTLSRRPRYDHFGTSPKLRSVEALFFFHLPPSPNGATARQAAARAGLWPSLAAAGASLNSFQFPVSSFQRVRSSQE